ncbi:MAG: hypothetical protein QW655_04825 [Nitrososphaerota archaeon]|nr:hypothetical protein [Candidatus Geocrenenecus dongiae]
MEWVEDSVVFRGAIRRSGNSLVITIPSELSQRFLLREGQEFVIYGIGRKKPYFEGGLQIYLGYFVVNEKIQTLKFRIQSPRESSEKLVTIMKEVGENYLASDVKYRQIDSSEVEVELHFGVLAEKGILRPKSREEIEDVAASLEFRLRAEGFKILEKEIGEKIVEWRNIDPALISKAPYKVTEYLRWRWEI